MSEEWQIRTPTDSEVEFQRLGVRYLARVDVGRMDASTEYFLRRGPAKATKGWRVSVPDLWRNKPGAETDGLRWLRVTKPSGQSVVLEFYRGLGPHDLARAYERLDNPHQRAAGIIKEIEL